MSEDSRGRRAALITGGARRLGAALSKAFAQAGYDIALHYNTTSPDSLLAELRGYGVCAEAFQANLADATQVEELMPRVWSRFPGLHILVNSASIFEAGTLAKTTTDALDRHWSVNLRAPVILTRDLAACLRAADTDGHDQKHSGGPGMTPGAQDAQADQNAQAAAVSAVVINILDTRLAGAGSSHAAYSLSKKGLEYLTELAAAEFAPLLRVNAVAPGLILPPPGKDEDYLSERARGIPLAKHGEPADIAAAALFLAEQPFITGQTIFVDGGEHL